MVIIGKIHSELKKIEDCLVQENENAPGETMEIFLQGIRL